MTTHRAERTELVVIGAGDRQQLQHRIVELSASLDRTPGLEVRELAAAAAQDFHGDLASHVPCRLAIVAADGEELKQRLSRAKVRLEDPACQKIRDGAGIYFVDQPLYRQGNVAFLFPGEGSQSVGMLSGLEEAFPGLDAIISQWEGIERELGIPAGSLRKCLFQASGTDQDELSESLQRFDVAVFAVMATSWCLLHVMEQLAIRPDVIAGHSAGESTALFASGAICDGTPSAILKALRGLSDSNESSTSMLAVGAGKQKVVNILRPHGLMDSGSSRVYVAMDNCPHQVVVVGPRDAILEAQQLLMGENLVVQTLDIPRPYHTPLFAPFMPPLVELFEKIQFQPPQVPIYSCTTTQPFPLEPNAIRDLAVEHWQAPVAFTPLIQQMHDDGFRVFVEVGPRGNLSAFAEDILRGRPASIVPAHRQGRSATTQIHHLVAELIVHHVPVRLAALYPTRSPLTLPWQESAKRSRIASDDLGLGQFPRDGGLGQDQRIAEATRATDPRPAGQRAWESAGGRGFRQRVLQRMQAMNSPASPRQSAMLRHQRLMGQFVGQQQEIMQRYLGLAAQVDENVPADALSIQRQNPVELSLPMMGQVVEHVPSEKLVMRRALDLAEDLYADHHTVGGQSISHVDPTQHGLPVMPMTFFLEVIAEGARYLFPHLKVTQVRRLRLRRWLPFYENDPGEIEVRLEVQQRQGDCVCLSAEIVDLGASRMAQKENLRGQAAVCEVVMQSSYPVADVPNFEPENQRPCTVDFHTLYSNLFHGPVLQGVTDFHRMGDHQIECSAEVQPRERILQSTTRPEFVLDPVTMDIVMHPLAAWHLAQPDQSGRIMLPFELEEIEFYGPPCEEGETLICRGELTDQSPRHFVHHLMILRKDGRPWLQMKNARFWRFYLPFHNVNFHGPKDVYYLTEDWCPALPATLKQFAALVALDPPADMGQGAVLTAAERVILSPKEQEFHEQLPGTAKEKTHRLFQLSAAKDAARRFVKNRHGCQLFAADIELAETSPGVFQSSPRDTEETRQFPQVTIAEYGGKIVAVAAEQSMAITLTDQAGAEPRHADEPDLHVLQHEQWIMTIRTTGDFLSEV